MNILTIEELQKVCATVEGKHRGNEWQVGIIPFAPAAEGQVLAYLRHWFEDLLP